MTRILRSFEDLTLFTVMQQKNTKTYQFKKQSKKALVLRDFLLNIPFFIVGRWRFVLFFYIFSEPTGILEANMLEIHFDIVQVILV